MGNERRYQHAPLRQEVDAQGRVIAIRGPRVPRRVAVATHHHLRDGERPDHMAHAYLGDSTAWWRLVDANEVMTVEQLTASRSVAIPGKDQE
ncbi:MAG: hypothetical protein KC731_41860 [Myxococcales bacterium]|nr:hypothetical protein [Myxococcales bacterium]